MSGCWSYFTLIYFLIAVERERCTPFRNGREMMFALDRRYAVSSRL